MRHALLAAAAASAILVSSASAADLVLPAAQEVFVPEDLGMTWDGFYIGAHIGAGAGTVHMDDDGDDDGIFDGDFDNAGWLAGVQAGYNAQFESLVVGVEADIAWTNLTSDDFDNGDELDDSFDVNALGSLRGRIGFAAENFLVYATAGGAFASTSLTMNGDDEVDDDGALLGWVAGVGAEAMLTDNMSLKAEYLFHDFGAETFEFGEAEELENDLLLHTFKVGVNFHF